MKGSGNSNRAPVEALDLVATISPFKGSRPAANEAGCQQKLDQLTRIKFCLALGISIFFQKMNFFQCHTFSRFETIFRKTTWKSQSNKIIHDLLNKHQTSVYYFKQKTVSVSSLRSLNAQEMTAHFAFLQSWQHHPTKQKSWHGAAAFALVAFLRKIFILLSSYKPLITFSTNL